MQQILLFNMFTSKKGPSLGVFCDILHRERWQDGNAGLSAAAQAGVCTVRQSKLCPTSGGIALSTMVGLERGERP